ncbi:hypothetical protein Tco_0214822 [Tanacetum coccineum]
MFSIRIHHGERFRRYLGRMYVDGHVDIFDMIDIDLFSVVALNMMVVQLGYTGKLEPLFYNYLRPVTTLDEGLYALACEEDVRCLATLVRSFKLIEVYTEHGVTAINSYQRPPLHVRATIEDITEPGSSAAIEHRSEKILLLTWHDSSAPTKESVCDFVTPRSLPHMILIHLVRILFVSPLHLGMPHGMLTPPTDEYVTMYTHLSGVQRVDTQDHVVPTIQSQFSDINLSFVSQQATASHVIDDVMRQLSFEETELDGEAGFGDVAGIGIDNYGLSHDESFGVDDMELNVSQTETQAELPVSEEANVVRTQKHIVEHVIVEDYVSSEEDAEQGSGQEDESTPSDGQFFHDVEGIDSSYETQYDVHSSEDAVLAWMFLLTTLVSLIQSHNVLEGKDVDVINLDGFDSNSDNDHEISNYRRRRDYVVELQSTNPNTTVKIVVERNIDPSLRTRAFQRIYVCLGALNLGFRACRREMLGLNGAFMKGPFPGQVLAVVGLDSNNEIYPLAYALVEAESSESESSESEYLGIIPAIKIVFPSAEHRFCLRHIHENMKKRWCGQAYKDLLWRYASATSVKEFEKCRAKSDLLLNNICEIFNRNLVRGRDKPVIELLEYIREYCMKRIEKSTCPTTLLPSKHHVQVGRPKKKRKRSKHEDEPFVKDGKLSKKGRTITCQSCENIRHNKATCKGQGRSGVGAGIGLSVADCAGGDGISEWDNVRIVTGTDNGGKELAYHKELLGEPQPPFSTLEPKIRRGDPWSLKIPCVIGTVYTGHAYIDLQSPINIMSRAYYNKIKEKPFQARRNPYQPYKFCNFVGRAKNMHIFVGCFVYVVDFMILEDLGSIIDNGLSEVVLGKPFAQTSKLTYDESLGLIRLYLMRRSLEVLRKFHWMILGGRSNQYFSFGRQLDELHMTWDHLEKKRTRLQTNTKTLEDLCSQSLEMASQAIHDAVITHQVTASHISRQRQPAPTQMQI